MALDTLLAGDLGGTKTLLLLAEREGRRILFERRYENASFGSLEEILRTFLAECRQSTGMPPPQMACLGVAGPVRNGVARITNLSWHVSEAELIRVSGAKRGLLLNDFEAVGYGIDSLEANEIIELQKGCPRLDGVRAVIGAGTGLGEAIMVPVSQGWKVIPGEGSHVDFAPRNDAEAGLWRWLHQRFGHVSYERVVSGAGLVNVLSFLREAEHLPLSAALENALQEGDQAAIISEFAVSGRDAVAVRALDVFVSIYGAEAGNLALKCLPYGGLYVAGGIAPKLAGKLADGRFIDAFREKGRFAGLMAEFPVRLVNNSRVGLLGAVQAARQLPI